MVLEKPLQLEFQFRQRQPGRKKNPHQWFSSWEWGSEGLPETVPATAVMLLISGW